MKKVLQLPMQMIASWALIALMAIVSPLLAQSSFNLSKNADFSSEDRVFAKTDTLYMKVTDADIDFTDIDENEFELHANSGGEKFEGAFVNMLDGTYSIALPLQVLNSSEASWRLKARIRDDSGHDFRTDLEIQIGDNSQQDEVNIKGSIESIGADFIVVKGTTIFVDAATKIEDKQSQILDFSDLKQGENVDVKATRRADDSLLATRIELKNRSKGEVEVKGAIDSVGTDHILVLGQTFFIGASTEILNKDKDPITLSDLGVGQFVEVKARPQADGTLLARKIKIESDSEDSEVELVGFIDSLTDSSVSVSGVLFAVDGATEILDKNKNPVSFGVLNIGQLVEVKARIQSDGALLAIRIKAEDDVPGEGEVEITGAIEAVSDQQVTVSGLVFTIDENTVIQDDRKRDISRQDLQVGVLVEIKAFLQSDGSLLAVRIKIEDRLTDEFEITGVIESVGDSSLVVNGHSFNIDPNTEILDDNKTPISFAELAVGLVVEIRADVLVDGILLATRIKIEDHGKKDEVEMTGTIDSLGTSSLIVGDVLFAVDAATVILDNSKNPIDFSALTTGLVVEVKGVLQADGSFLAVRIKVEDRLQDEIEIKGTVDSLTDTQITVAGVTFGLTENTIVLDNNKNPIALGDVSIGALVEIRGELLPGGTLVAIRIKLEDVNQDEFEVKATIDSIGASSIVVLGVEVGVDINTVFLDHQNNSISFTDLTVNQFVEVRALLQADGSLLATRIKVEDVRAIGGTMDDVSGSSFSLLGAQIGTDANTLVLGAFNTPKTLADLVNGQKVQVRATQQADGSFLASKIKLTNSFVTGIADSKPGVAPENFTLLQNYPNPFNPTTTIVFTVKAATSAQTSVNLVIYNMLGQQVATLLDKPMQAGVYRVQWDGRNGAGQLVPSGVYLYRLTTERLTQTSRMILLK